MNSTGTSEVVVVEEPEVARPRVVAPAVDRRPPLRVVPKPNPVRASALQNPDDAVAIRQLHCLEYSACLDEAVEKNWPGMSCEHCEAFVPLTARGERRDMLGHLELLVEAGFLRARRPAKRVNREEVE